MDDAKIRRALRHALEQSGYTPEGRRHDIVFHMTDWLDDLEQWSAFCQAPDRYEAEAVEKLLTGFLVHVPNHLAAASKLMLNIPVSDIFEVGALDEDE